MLVISPLDYLVHFVTVGEAFNASWMRAEDKGGLLLRDDQARAKFAIVGLFPALSERNPSKFSLAIPVEEVLVGNKKLFPTLDEKEVFDSKTIIAKATVRVN